MSMKTKVKARDTKVKGHAKVQRLSYYLCQANIVVIERRRGKLIEKEKDNERRKEDYG